jgi:CheY-like chemotaxis protein
MAKTQASVLIVDDDRAIRDAVRELLETEGYEVVEAANGSAALARLSSGLRPSVIILDLMMPAMDGWDFRSEQLRHPELKTVPVVIITAVGFSVDTLRKQFGEVGVLLKPVSPQQVLDAVRQVAAPPGAA